MKLRSAMYVVSFVALSALGAAACGGFSTEDAEARCTQELEAREASGCFTNTSFEECVAAYEECGDDAIIQEGCPVHYSCEGSEPEETGGAGE